MLDELKAVLEKKGFLHQEITDRDWHCKFCYLGGHYRASEPVKHEDAGTRDSVLFILFRLFWVFETKSELLTHDIEKLPIQNS